jgi:sugar phosphate isomerase/epimerase
MTTIKGPAVFLAQFLGDKAPYNSLENICQWAANKGFKGIQIPTWDARCINLQLAAESKTYADELTATVAKYGLAITELSTHLQGQLVAVHPAYNEMFDGFAPENLRNSYTARQQWAVQQLLYAAKASANLGLTAHATFSGALCWPYFFNWPQRTPGLVDEAFAELAKRWLPILNSFDEEGVDVCYEIHPGEDLHDGISYELFLDKVHNHSRANILYDPSHLILQCIDYLGYIDVYHERIKAFHVKDAEFNPTAKQGVYGGFQDWINRAGRFRSVGDGQINFKDIFSKLTQYNFSGWAVLEWECCLKHYDVGATEGAQRIKNWIIEVTDKAFDDFAAANIDAALNKKILGI